MESIKKINKLFFVLTLIFSLNITTNVKATEFTTVPDDFGQPIEVHIYEEKNGCIVTEKIYFIPDEDSDGISLYSSSGRGWYKNEKEHIWEAGTIMKYYAQGYFVWGNGTVSVSSPSGDVSNVPSSVTISNKKIKTGTGKYAGIFNNYAYVDFSFTATNQIGLKTDFSVAIRISESGNHI